MLQMTKNEGAREGMIWAPLEMCMIRTRSKDGYETWRHIAKCAVADLIKKNSWKLLEQREVEKV